MSGQRFNFHLQDPHQAYHELDRITKLLIRRDLMLNEANALLDEKVRTLETTQQALTHASEYMHSLLTNSPDAIWVLDQQGKVTTFNKSAEEITGYQSAEVIGRRLDFLFYDPNVYENFLRQLAQGRSFRNLRLAIRRRDGQRADLLMSIAIIMDPMHKTEPVASITISKNLTREIRLEKALREANEQLEEKVLQRTRDLETLSQRLAVLNQVALVASQSLELDPLLNNILQVVLELAGFPMGGVSTFDDQDVIRIRAFHNYPPFLLERHRRLKKDDNVIGQAVATGKLQVAPPMLPESIRAGIKLVVAVPLIAKGVTYGVMSLMSTEDREISEEERHLLLAIGVQAGWALENARLYEQVREDVVKLKEVDRIKTEFIATISHELRTPLTSIIGYLRYALMTLQDSGRPDLERYIHVAMENSRKLARMIEDLLAMQKLESGTLKFHFEPLKLRTLLERLDEEMSPQLHAKGQTMRLSIPEDFPDLLVDHEQFERVLTNLITNAIKFSGQAGTITIAACHQPGEFLITVADTGIGMTPEIQEKIFERFYQAENSFTRKIGGVGLGLTIAKRIIEMHGGTIDVESEPRRGSRFTIRLPEIEKTEPSPPGDQGG